jgi:hypothetical protein
VSVPAILLALAVLSCLLLVSGMYGLLELFGPPDLSRRRPRAADLCLVFSLPPPCSGRQPEGSAAEGASRHLRRWWTWTGGVADDDDGGGGGCCRAGS